MTDVDPNFAMVLKSEASFVRIAGADTRGVPATSISPFAQRASAVAEAERLSAILSGPLVRDRVVVDGAQRDLAGKCLSLSGGPADGALVFVLGVAEQDTDSVLTVLRVLQ